MIKSPVNGMKDIEPKEMEIRQFVLSKIREVYKKFGYLEIETPNMEHIENLLSDNGWENEKLIFKILKRGEKLEKAKESDNINDLIDSGLRYDLTVPLCRFYANNKDKLISPFKSLQIGNVFRADRPQKGRFRQFCQCDIDILGEPSNLGEIETLLATTTLLKEVGFDKYNLSIDINDRKILKAINNYAGFLDEQFDNICIILDKLDKIGIGGVKKELLDSSLDENKVNKYISLFDNSENDAKKYIKIFCDNLKDYLSEEVINNLLDIVEVVEKNSNIKINFNPSLVRGMGYYTGTIFEIKSEMFSSSIGGGGRYDEMIYKFIGQEVPAVGISLGFERIISLLTDDNFKVPTKNKNTAYLIDKNISDEKKYEVFKKAMEERNNGKNIYIATIAKNKRFQKENLSSLGYEEFIEFI